MWLDEDGLELPDPPKEVVDILCPSCEILDEEQHDRQQPGHRLHGKYGVKLGLRLVPQDDIGDAASD